MTDWSTLKKLIWLRIIKGGGSALRTVTGALIHVTNALALPAEALTVNVEPIQAGSGDPSPDNVRPISGRTSATIYHSGADTSDPTTYTIQLGETVYGGTLDVAAGTLTVDRAKYTFSGNEAWALSGASFFYLSLIASGVNVSNYYITENGVKLYLNGNNGQCRVYLNDNSFLSASSDMHDYLTSTIGFVYELAQPITITLTPTQIDMLLGENNLWSDAGDSTLTYYADGNASTSEALGILLGGTYNNPGGADDVSDDEALGILLGGT